MTNMQIFNELERNGVVFESLLHDLPEEIYRWRVSEDKWNLLDVICHMLDEEREDFRVRLSLILKDPNATLPSINPEGWVKEHHYISQNYEATLDSFLAERDRSVDRLKSLKNPNWDNSYEHPKYGKMSAQLFLNNWLAHDLLHLRQILSIKHHYLKEHTNQSLNYSGNW